MIELKKGSKEFNLFWRIALVLFISAIHYNSYSQASWEGKFYFNLKDCKGDILTIDDIAKKEIFFYSFNSKNKI